MFYNKVERKKKKKNEGQQGERIPTHTQTNKPKPKEIPQTNKQTCLFVLCACTGCVRQKSTQCELTKLPFRSDVHGQSTLNNSAT